MSKRLTLNEFIIKSNTIHDNKYDYTKTKYINNKTKVIITCPIHGSWEQTPNSHMKGKGCLQCGFIKTTKNQPSTLTKEEFITKANKIHSNKYEYVLATYINNKSKLKITCHIHGEFEQTPSKHLTGHGCQSCAKTGFDTAKPAILYYLKINGGQCYKIGITNKTINERFSNSDLQIIEVVKTWYYENGAEAYANEQKILKEYSNYKYRGSNLLESGNTELFIVDVLNLD